MALKESANFKIPTLKDIVLVEKLGSGTYATVYRGYRKGDEDKNPFAVKCIKRSSLNKISVENLLVEIEILKQIKHDHIVQLIDIQWDRSYIYLIMEYCAGGDLATFIQTRPSVPESVVKRFLQQIASALQLLHNHNIAHMDLKPQNILLSSKDQPVLKLADFGFAQYLEKEQDFRIRGTPLYMAPEMLLQHHYDAKVDLWSVGVILYETLFGRAPFASKSFDELEVKIKSDQPIEVPAYPPISHECQHLLICLLQRNPQDRISFEDFFDDPYVDLEHKPSSSSIEKASDLVKEAVAKDQKGEVGDAVQLYMRATEYFVPAIHYERDIRKKQLLRQKVREYIDRAEQLKQLLKPSESQLEMTSLQKLTQLSKDEPKLQEGLQLLVQARNLDTNEQFVSALQSYEKALSMLLALIPEESNNLRKNLLHGIVQDSLKRAEQIKEYIKVRKLKRVTSREVAEAGNDSHSSLLTVGTAMRYLFSEPILIGIQPAELRRQGATLSPAYRSLMNPKHQLHQLMGRFGSFFAQQHVKSFLTGKNLWVVDSSVCQVTS